MKRKLIFIAICVASIAACKKPEPVDPGTKPGTETTDPGTETTDPGDNPENPENPENPGSDPTEGVQPDENGDLPGSPAKGTIELDQLVGYGNKTTGGKGAAASNIVYFDNGPAFQTWLNAREKAKSTVPAIVYLTGTFHSGDGRGTSSPWFDIKRTSNITIIGTKGFVMDRVGFFLNGAANIIIRNVYIKMPKADNGADGISMQDSENVWVDHCTFESMNQEHDYEDGSCDITHATKYVTVSWCRFIKTQKSCLVGHSNSATDDVNIRATFHHNWFNNSSSRHPRVRFGRVHVFNNYYDGCTTYGVGSAYGAMVLVEGNIFNAVKLPTDICTYPAKKSGSSWVSNLTGSVAGFLYPTNNLYINRPAQDANVQYEMYPMYNTQYEKYGSAATKNYQYDDFKPDYDYVIEDTQGLASKIMSGAGAGILSQYDNVPEGAVQNAGITSGGGDGEGGDGEGDGGEGGGDTPTVDTNSGICSFGSDYKPTNGCVTIVTGNGSNSKGSVTYDGVEYKYCIKMESSTVIEITPIADGNVTLIFGGSTAAAGKKIKLDGTSVTLDSNGYHSFAATKGTKYTLTKGDSINLFLILLPKASE